MTKPYKTKTLIDKINKHQIESLDILVIDTGRRFTNNLVIDEQTKTLAIPITRVNLKELFDEIKTNEKVCITSLSIDIFFKNVKENFESLKSLISAGKLKALSITGTEPRTNLYYRKFIEDNKDLIPSIIQAAESNRALESFEIHRRYEHNNAIEIAINNLVKNTPSLKKLLIITLTDSLIEVLKDNNTLKKLVYFNLRFTLIKQDEMEKYFSNILENNYSLVELIETNEVDVSQYKGLWAIKVEKFFKPIVARNALIDKINETDEGINLTDTEFALLQSINPEILKNINRDNLIKILDNHIQKLNDENKLPPLRELALSKVAKILDQDEDFDLKKDNPDVWEILVGKYSDSSANKFIKDILSIIEIKNSFYGSGNLKADSEAAKSKCKRAIEVEEERGHNKKQCIEAPQNEDASTDAPEISAENNSIDLGGETLDSEQ